MAYSRENLLRRIADIQDIVLEHRKHDTPFKTIWKKHIFPVYRISYSCFNEYMTVNAKTQLKQLQAKKAYQEQENPKLF